MQQNSPFNQQQIDRQDFVDSTIYEMLLALNPTSQKIDWNIEQIGAVRDIVSDILVTELKVCRTEDFYP